MSKINAFSRVLNQKVKTRFFMDFQLMDNLTWLRSNISEKQQFLGTSGKSGDFGVL